MSRIPFRLHKKTDAKLNELFELDIIEERLKGLLGWVSPLVVIPNSGSVLICVVLTKQLSESVTQF